MTLFGVVERGPKSQTFLKYSDTSMMSNTKRAAEGYQQISCMQRFLGRKLIDDVNPCPGDVILDLGCGTGELSACLAEHVGQDGKVVAVDPDIARLELAQESNREVKNLTFHEGSASNFPGMGHAEMYDMVFCNAVLHWVQNKQEAFKNMLCSLKQTGKIVVLYIDRLPTLYERVYGELNPENWDRLLSMYHFKSRLNIEEMCTALGFSIIKSYDIKADDREYENVESMCSIFWATSHGVFDPKLVTKDRLASFCTRYTSGEDSKPFKVFADKGDYHCILIAEKSATK